jgi:hypothetical protein
MTTKAAHEVPADDRARNRDERINHLVGRLADAISVLVEAQDQLERETIERADVEAELAAGQFRDAIPPELMPKFDAIRLDLPTREEWLKCLADLHIACAFLNQDSDTAANTVRGFEDIRPGLSAGFAARWEELIEGFSRMANVMKLVRIRHGMVSTANDARAIGIADSP